ncbi:hypothetical protein M0811_06422 [Anaeramoeba ignava]|uniref:Fibronectin type-III domain-containing protein n=1 Tax=Anaeramoeba ignava TaxID=1746090 RepID=A0A9Q0RDQ9_ANAIG|nr:hypothetical protein M0811_06422 [Anaeramoeba ignava]
MENLKITLVGVAQVEDNPYEGKVYIFQKNGIIWNQSQIIIANDNINISYFGASVSIQENIFVAGAPSTDILTNENQGKAYIFRNNGSFWNQESILIASDGNKNNYFGTSVGIDENFCIVGTRYAEVGNNSNQGKAYIFENFGSNWIQKQILIASDGKQDDLFGWSVSISQNFCLIGAFQANIGNNSKQGKTYIFENNGTFWIEKQILIASDGKANDQFGSSVSISISNSDKFLVVGASNADVGDNTTQGKAYVFENNGTFWIEKQILIASDGKSTDEFSSSISIDEYAIVSGASTANVGENQNEGKAYIFRNNGTFWNQEAILIASDGQAYDHFGKSVSISGNISLIGAYYSKVGQNIKQGKSYIFDGPPLPPQVNLLNCTPLFSSFECYWDEIHSLFEDIEYKINYNVPQPNWHIIYIPILYENVFYEIFNYSVYPNITGNVEYSIEIKGCNISTAACGNASNQINLTTRIDCVKNLTFETTTDSITLYWDYPNVPIINSTPKLDHYFLSYQNTTQTTNISISNSSTSFQITNLEIFANYSVSISPCRTQQCSGEDEGQILSSSIMTIFGNVLDLSCSLSNLSVVSCLWNPPNDSINPSYYSLTFQSTSANDTANYSTDSTSHTFTAKYLDHEYKINVSACNPNRQCGSISTFLIKTGVFGNVLNLSCSLSDFYFISCTWEKPNDPINPLFYNFTYQSQNDFGIRPVDTTQYSFKSRFSNEEYQIFVFACDEYFDCGNCSIFTIETGKESNSANSSTSKKITIICSIVIPLLIIFGVFSVFLYKKIKKMKRIERIEKEQTEVNKSLMFDDV